MVNMELKLDYPKVVFDKENDVNLLVQLTAPEIKTTTKRNPVNISVVMDLSTSMDDPATKSLSSTTKLDIVKKSLLKLVANLTDDDTLSLIGFADKSWIVSEPRKMTSDSKMIIESEIQSMRSSGCTNLSSGILRAFDVLRSGEESVLTRVMVFTDGQANIGVHREQDLVELLKKELPGSDDPGPSINLSTFGFGSDHNGSCLTALSEVGGGNFYYIESLETAPAAFGRELGGLLSCYAQNVKVMLALNNGIELIEVKNNMDVTTLNGVTTILAGDIYSEESINILISFKTSKISTIIPRSDRLCDVNIEYLDIETRDINKIQSLASITYVNPGDETLEPSDELKDQTARFKVVEFQENAYDLAQSGDISGAKDTLAVLREYLETVGTTYTNTNAIGIKTLSYTLDNFDSQTKASFEGYTRSVSTEKKMSFNDDKFGVDSVIDKSSSFVKNIENSMEDNKTDN